MKISYSDKKSDRIIKHYRAERRRRIERSSGGYAEMHSELLLFLAKYWKMPCREIKQIIGYVATPKAIAKYVMGQKDFINKTLFFGWVNLVMDDKRKIYRMSVA